MRCWRRSETCSTGRTEGRDAGPESGAPRSLQAHPVVLGGIHVHQHAVVLRRHVGDLALSRKNDAALRVAAFLVEHFAIAPINQELEAFGYSISHDMRAPLRSIRSFAQFLREQAGDKLEEEGRDYLERIERAAKYMDLLLLDLLQYSRLSSCELELVKVDLGAAVSDVLASIEPEVEERKADIQVRQPLGAVMAHPATLRQVIYNLISNALKFVSPEQTPRIEIWSEPRGGVVRFWVADWGIGIASQYHKKIFGLFQRLHSQESYPGTGIGLALVRKGIERMDGRIGVESQAGQGTRFWFEVREPALVEG